MGRRTSMVGRGVAGALGCALLSGCGAGNSGFDTQQRETGYSLSTLTNLIAFNKLFPDAAPLVQTEMPIECPTVEVRDGTASLRVYGGGDQSNANVRYGYSLGDVARECAKSGDLIRLRLGVEGRVLIGPAGQPGSFAVPIRIAVRNDVTQKVISSQLVRVPAAVPAGATQAGFSYVSEPFTVPFVAHPDEDYVILVGFDALGKDAPSERKPRGRKQGG